MVVRVGGGCVEKGGETRGRGVTARDTNRRRPCRSAAWRNSTLLYVNWQGQRCCGYGENTTERAAMLCLRSVSKKLEALVLREPRVDKPILLAEIPLLISC